MTIDPHELRSVADRFGVSDEQVRRDHAISHLLAALSRESSAHVVFFGGTALSRTHLPDLRLSEDVDLIAVGDRGAAVRSVERAFDSREVRRELGRVSWRPRLQPAGSRPASVVAVTGESVKVQLLSAAGYPDWPTEEVALVQRYRTAPPARLRVLTADAFAAAKLSAWLDRRASRDLYDLWAMAGRGMVTGEAAALYRRWGRSTRVPARTAITEPPRDDWVTALGAQTRIAVGWPQAAEVVADAWEAHRV